MRMKKKKVRAPKPDAADLTEEQKLAMQVQKIGATDS